MDNAQLFTWGALGTMAGSSLLTFLVVQYTKVLVDRIAAKWLPTDLYAVLIGTLILIAAQLATGAPANDWRVYVLALANGFLVAAAAGQLQHKAINPPGQERSGSE